MSSLVNGEPGDPSALRESTRATASPRRISPSDDESSPVGFLNSSGMERMTSMDNDIGTAPRLRARIMDLTVRLR